MTFNVKPYLRACKAKAPMARPLIKMIPPERAKAELADAMAAALAELAAVICAAVADVESAVTPVTVEKNTASQKPESATTARAVRTNPFML